MFYKLVSRSIWAKAAGKWEIVRVCKTIPEAKAAMRLLRALEKKENNDI